MENSFKTCAELINTAVSSDVTEYVYDSGHIEYRLWTKSGGYIAIEEHEYFFILHKEEEDNARDEFYSEEESYADYYCRTSCSCCTDNEPEQWDEEE